MKNVISIKPAPEDACDAHIASFVVQTRPECQSDRLSDINAIDGVEVVANDASGKLILTAETDTERDIVTVLETVRNMSGVITANLVYHHVEDKRVLDQEVFFEPEAIS